MTARETTIERYDPEQAGIILDRLAGELLRISPSNSRALPALQVEARQFLYCIEPWLAVEARELAVAAEEIAPIRDPNTLAQGLRQLSERLLELAHEAPLAIRKAGAS